MPTVRTVTVKSAGGDYSSLSAAEAGEQGNLVTLDRQLDIECYAFEDTAQATFGGWTTDATRYIRIYTPTSERHDGKWDTTAYRLRITSGWAGFFNAFACSVSDIWLDGIQISAEPTVNGRTAFAGGTATRLRVSNCVIRVVPGATTGHTGISVSGTGVGNDNKVWNNVIYLDGTATGTGINSNVGDFNIVQRFHNNTVYGFTTGINKGGGNTNSHVAKNNLVNGCTTCFSSSSWSAASVNNLSEDATSPNSSLRNLAVAFVDETNKDFHLASGDTAAKDAGADLSADADLAFSTDIDGDTRSGTWDIGADEFVSGAGPQTISAGAAELELSARPLTLTAAAAVVAGAAQANLTARPQGVVPVVAVAAGAAELDFLAGPATLAANISAAAGPAQANLSARPQGVTPGPAPVTLSVAIAYLQAAAVAVNGVINAAAASGYMRRFWWRSKK